MVRSICGATVQSAEPLGNRRPFPPSPFSFFLFHSAGINGAPQMVPILEEITSLENGIL
jgi:hypothetical protein